MNKNIIPVILAGGAGTRLWPLSREQYPKQFLQLFGDCTLLQATLRRARQITRENPIIVSHNDHRFIAAEQVAELNLGPAQLLLEPTGRNTAIAIACAAHAALQRNPNALLLVLPADHVIQDEAALTAAVQTAASAAEHGQLMTFGITPRFPATGYGYIARGENIPNAAGAFRVSHFVEKPEAERAEQLWLSGAWLWNSGMFLLRADVYLHELRAYAPKIADAAQEAFQKAKSEGDAIRLAAEAYEYAPNRSIDHAVMEHTAHAGVVPCDLGWSDIGSWGALWDIGAQDENHNVLLGDVITHATENCYIRSERPLIATYGLQDAVVVATQDVVMVSSRHQPQEIKAIIEKLREAKREELSAPRRVHRPWGSYETIIDGPDFKVKKIIVKPGARLSLQRHQHRSEHWVMVSGIGEVEIVEPKSQLKRELTPNTSAYIPKGAIHRLSNPGTEEIEVIEVQCGDYLGEDDIERFSDDYGRDGLTTNAA
jgi:mannose-1-phosphate guanylyltransferase/mannose-6-phosphate isomerase